MIIKWTRTRIFLPKKYSSYFLKSTGGSININYIIKDHTQKGAKEDRQKKYLFVSLKWMMIMMDDVDPPKKWSNKHLSIYSFILFHTIIMYSV